MHGGMGLSKNILVNQFGIVEGNQDFFHLSEGGVKLFFLASEGGGQTFFENFLLLRTLDIRSFWSYLHPKTIVNKGRSWKKIRASRELLTHSQISKNNDLSNHFF